MSLDELLESYHSAHQISKTVNILDIAEAEGIGRTVVPTQCICNYLEPHTGWNRNVKNTGADGEKCFHCLKQLASTFPDFPKDVKVLEGCKTCYLFACKKYTEREGGFRLTEKFIRKKKMK